MVLLNILFNILFSLVPLKAYYSFVNEHIFKIKIDVSWR
jgi:hypothetical protein